MAENISRRSFLKGVTAGAIGLGTMGLAAASAESVKAMYKAGTYTSVQKTEFATVEVVCTFSQSALTDVSYNVTESLPGDFFSGKAPEVEAYCKRIVETGSTVDVDGISGATLCASAIKAGVDECMTQALGIEAAAAEAAHGLNPQDYDYTGNSITDFTKTKLFSEWKLGPLTLKHRMVKSAAFQLAFMRNNPEEYIGYYERMARGGVQMIWIENFANMWDMTASPFKQDYSAYDVKGMVDRLHAAGAYVGTQFDTMGAPIGPLSYTEPFIGNYSTEEVKEWIQVIIGMAKRLHEDGFDAFELNFAANNVGQSFLSRARNNRTDEYGPQSIESRTRFGVEVVKGIKEACGKDFIVQVLINSVEENDTNLGDNEAFNSIEEVREIAKAFEAAGADSLHLRQGPGGQHIAQFAPDLYFCARGQEGTTGFGTKFDFKQHYQGLARGNHSGCGFGIDIAAAVKQAVSIPVGTVSYMDPAHAPDYFEQALQENKIDFIIMNRPLCVDPEYVNKLREGRIDEIAPCTRCLHCFYDPDRDGKLMEHCRVNAANWRAYGEDMPEGFDPAPAAEAKNVMVIGGGPAGMEAARIAAGRGHSVTLYEKENALGGTLGFAEAVKGPHENLGRLSKYLARQQEVCGVTVITGTEVTREVIATQKPDVVILAVGAKRPEPVASAGTPVVSVEDVLGAKLGNRVVVLGSNCQAVDAALYLMDQGKQVTIVTPSPKAAFEKGHSVNVRGFVETAIKAAGTRIWSGVTGLTVGESGVSFTSEAGFAIDVACDAVVDASDCLPNTALTDGLEGVTVIPVGDCKAPYNIAAAISDGNLAARSI